MLQLAFLPLPCHQFNVIPTTMLPALRTFPGQELKVTSTAKASQLPILELIFCGGASDWRSLHHIPVPQLWEWLGKWLLQLLLWGGRTNEGEYQKGLGHQQIWQTPTEDGRYLAQCLGPSRCSVKVSFFSPFSFTDFHPSDPKLWGCINNAVWVDEKATMYYLRLPERNSKFSPCCRHLPERQAAGTWLRAGTTCLAFA